MDYLKVTKVEGVTLYRRGQAFTGTLHLTTHHLIFTVPPPAESNGISKQKLLELWFCYPMIERVDFNRGSALLYQTQNQGEGHSQLSSNSNSQPNSASQIPSNANGQNESTRRSSNPSSSDIIIELNSRDNKSENNNDNNNSDNFDNSSIVNIDFEPTQRKLCRGACLRIQCRDFNYISFDFKNVLKCNDAFESIMKLTCINNIDTLYAFIYQPVKIELQFNGWKDYNIIDEFERQGLNFGSGNGKEGEEGAIEGGKGCDKWRITSLNEEYTLCETYPSLSCIPASISDTMLGHTVKYRSKKRFPSLTYYYKKNGCSIIRCSQPMVGIKQNRSIQDENIIKEVFKTNGLLEGKNLIVDARPLTNAMAQVALGAGTEMMDYYGVKSRKVFLNIENIHVMRDSLNKIKESLRNTDVDGNKIPTNKELLDKSGWLEHISRLLKATDLLVKWIDLEGVHLIIHCSDGWDRTSQICSLVEICLDPFYRTVEGFIILVEKEWSSFGHRFNERCGHLQRETKFYNHTEESNFQRIKQLNQHFKHQQNIKYESPVFQQFLDCLYQLLRQFPNKFEYNERFLRRLVYHLYSCQYGTFLSDNEKERKNSKLEERTRSVWDYFKSRPREFKNENYVLSEEVLFPNFTDVIFWYQLFGKSKEDMNGDDVEEKSRRNCKIEEEAREEIKEAEGKDLGTTDKEKGLSTTNLNSNGNTTIGNSAMKMMNLVFDKLEI